MNTKSNILKTILFLSSMTFSLELLSYQASPETKRDYLRSEVRYCDDYETMKIQELPPFLDSVSDRNSSYSKLIAEYRSFIDYLEGATGASRSSKDYNSEEMARVVKAHFDDEEWIKKLRVSLQGSVDCKIKLKVHSGLVF